jgi:hypothetical protein
MAKNDQNRPKSTKNGQNRPFRVISGDSGLFGAILEVVTGVDVMGFVTQSDEMSYRPSTSS